MFIKFDAKNGFAIGNKTSLVNLATDKITINKSANDGTSSSPYTITTPGEYEVAGAGVFAYVPFPSILVELDHIAIVYLPNPPESFTADVVSELDRVDVLLVPGKRADLVEKLAPLLVIPLDDATLLAEKMGTALPETIKTLTLKSRDELPEETQLVVVG